MAPYLDWRLDELYPVERGATTRRTGKASRRPRPGEVDSESWTKFTKSLRKGYDTAGQAKYIQPTEASVAAGKGAWNFGKAFIPDKPTKGRQRRSVYKPHLEWGVHPANPATEREKADQLLKINKNQTGNSQASPVTEGSVADQQTSKGQLQIIQENKKRRQEGEPPTTPGEQNKPKTGEPKETKAQKNAREAKGLNTLAAALGDRRVQTHTVRVGEIDEDPYGGVVGV